MALDVDLDTIVDCGLIYGWITPRPGGAVRAVPRRGERCGRHGGPLLGICAHNVWTFRSKDARVGA